jgi:hypothetical protein
MEKVEKLDTIWEVPDELWEEIESLITELAPPQAYRTQAGQPQVDAQRHYLPDAKQLSVEPFAQGLGRRQHYPSDLPEVGSLRSLPPDLDHHSVPL